MKRLIKLTVTFVIILISVCGCNDLKKASKNTSIDKVNSYRAKVSIKSDNFNEDYVIFNKGNNEYIINFTDNSNSYSAKINKNGTVITDLSGNKVNIKLKYDYTNTDIFLKGIKTKSDKSETEKINNKEYTKYTFSVSKNVLNKMLKPFGISVNDDGEGYAYIDSNNKAYIVNYSSNNTVINVSYTNIGE